MKIRKIFLFVLVFLACAASAEAQQRHRSHHRQQRAVTAEELLSRANRVSESNPAEAARLLLEVYGLRPAVCGLLLNAGNRLEAAASLESLNEVARREYLERALEAYQRFLHPSAEASCPASPEEATTLAETRVADITGRLHPEPPAPVTPVVPVTPPPDVHPPPTVIPPVARYQYVRPVRGASVGLWIGGGLLTGVGIYTFVHSVHDFAVADEPGEDRPRRQEAAEINMYIAVPTVLVGAAGIACATYMHLNRPTLSRRVALLPDVRPGFAGLSFAGAF